MKTLKVMQLGSPTGLYGAERWILALIRHLDRSSIESVVGTIRDADDLQAPLCEEAKGLGFQTHIIEARGRINMAAVRLLRRFIVENDVHILHTHGYKTDLVGVLATSGTQCLQVSTPHGWSVRAGFKLRLYEAIDRLALTFCDGVAPLSQALFDELRSIPGMKRKLHLIRNAVDIDEIDESGAIAAEVAAWKAQGSFVIGYIGQLIERKGLHVLLKAFAALDIPNKKLAIVGDGNQRAELVEAANELGIAGDTHFFGFREDRLALLRGFDVFVLPSTLEGIPRCLMESMAANVCVVASNIPGCLDLVEHEQTGLLFESGSVESLRLALLACASPDVRLRLTAKARDFVVANYSAGSMARQYRDLFMKLHVARYPGRLSVPVAS
ncbi:MAG: glycosyltransferase [Steroidobacteraceae bacterium]